MKTTVEIPDELFRQAKTKAALEGVPLRELFVRGLQLAMEEQKRPIHHMDFPLLRTQAGSPPITDEQVKAAQQAMDDEDAERYASYM